jgi:hypothetical protein
MLYRGGLARGRQFGARVNAQTPAWDGAESPPFAGAALRVGSQARDQEKRLQPQKTVKADRSGATWL